MVTKNSDYDRFLQEAVECLCDSLLEDSVVKVRCKAAESLGQLIGKLKTKDGISTASQVLRKALREDPDENVREKAAEALGKIGEQPTMSGDRIINTQNYYENINTGGGNYIQGDYMNMSQDLSQAASQIQSLLEKLQQQGIKVDVAQEQVAQDIVNQANNNPKIKDKLINWGQSLGNATITDVVKGAVKLAIHSAGIPLP